MNRFLPVVASGAMLLGACSAETIQDAPKQESSVSTSQPAVEMVFEGVIPEQQMQTTKSTGEHYASVYGCASNKVTVTLGQFATEGQNGAVIIVEAESDPGSITFNSNTLVTDAAQKVRNTTAHEMTHACQTNEPIHFANPITLADGAVATGVHGFGILVELPSGERTKFMKIEEGVAEAEASLLYPDYKVDNPQYFKAGNLTRYFMNQHGITGSQLAGMVQTNNLAEYVNKIGNPNQPFETNLISAMNKYQEAFNS